MKQNRNFLRFMNSVAELDGEPLPGVPLVEIFDQRRVLIENHHGVLRYSVTEVLVRVRFGSICVFGDNLCIKNMSRDRLIVTGGISGVKLQRSC